MAANPSTIKVAHVSTVDLALRYLLLNQLKRIQSEGYEVCGISARGENVPVLEAAGIRHIAVPLTRRLTPFRDLVALWTLYRIMRRERFDIVHTHTPKPGLLGQLAARMAGVPVVVNTLHGFYFHDGTRPLARSFYVMLERIAAQCSDVILSQNSEDIRTAIRERIASEDILEYLGNGIDLTQFDPEALDNEKQDALRRSLGIPRESPVVGFVGRLVVEKGLLELFEAARTIRERVPNVRFLAVGPIDTGKPDALEPATAKRYGVEDIFVFTGIRNDMPALYGLMNVLALPSYREGFPRAPMEASAMGVPCVVSDIRGCREAVRQNENGLLVPSKDPSALANAIASILLDPSRAASMGQTGRTMARELFDEQRVFEKVLSHYGKLLQERGRAHAVNKKPRARHSPRNGNGHGGHGDGIRFLGFAKRGSGVQSRLKT